MDGIETLLEIDPNSTEWLEKAGNYGWMTGQVSRALRNASDAERRDLAAVARLTQLVSKDRDNVGWQRKLALAHLENAQRLLDLRELAAAREAATAAETAAAAALTRAKDDVANQLASAQVQVTLGDIAEAQGNDVLARIAWARGRDLIDDRAKASRDPAMRQTWLGARLRIGGDAEAIVAAQQLANSGYRDPDFVAVLEAKGIPIVAVNVATRHIAGMNGRVPNNETTRD
jgi:hypothetical protein